MNIGFFSEAGYEGKVPRNHPNMRTDVAWVCALDATHHPLPKIQALPVLVSIESPKMTQIRAPYARNISSGWVENQSFTNRPVRKIENPFFFFVSFFLVVKMKMSKSSKSFLALSRTLLGVRCLYFTHV